MICTERAVGQVLICIDDGKRGSNTYHTSLGINLSYKVAITARVRKLWARKTILVIDEMSMIDLKMLGVINNQCKIARSLPRSSPERFGGLPIVILMGDFFQFPPVRVSSCTWSTVVEETKIWQR